MVKMLQVQETEILIAMSFWALGGPMTCTIGFIFSGIVATIQDKKLVSVSTTMVDGLAFGAANLLMLGVTTVMSLMFYAYLRYALRLQMKEIPTLLTVLFFGSYAGLFILFAAPHAKVKLSPYDYGIQLIGFEIYIIFEIAWMMYYSRWMKSNAGKVLFVLALVLAGVLLVASWVLAAVAGEKYSAPVEWCCTGIIIGMHSIVVFMCERDKVMKLNSNGFSQHVSGTPQEYEQL